MNTHESHKAAVEARTTVPETVAARASGYRRDLVVAGVDGSACARHAAWWAAAEAARRHGALRLIHCYELPPAGYSNYNPYPANLLSQLRQDGEDLLAEAVVGLRRDYPRLAISTQQVHGDAATVLRQASADAVLTVVGTHGRHRVALTAGAVAADIARPAPALLSYAGTAQLIVVGTRGHGKLTNMLLGSTSNALINHANCAVVIARPHPAG